MKTRLLLAFAATTALLISLPAHAQSSSSFDAYGRPLASTEQLCAQARQMGRPVTERCAWLQWSGSSAPTQPYTATRTQLAPAPTSLQTEPDPHAVFEGFRLALSHIAAYHGHDGAERVSYSFDKWGFDHTATLPLWIAMRLDTDDQMRNAYISDNPKWKRVPPTGHLDFWQKW